MSISSMPLPPTAHHAHAPQPLVSASVTRILTLSNFSAELKTRDLQAVFARWADDRGGFKIKWIDDITALAVFADANVGEWDEGCTREGRGAMIADDVAYSAAKRAYLALILDPPASLPPPATIRPYDGPDAQAIIHSVAARTHGGPAGHASRASFAGSTAPRIALAQGGSFSIPPPAAAGAGVHGRASSVSASGSGSAPRFGGGGFNGVMGGGAANGNGMGTAPQGIARHDRGASMSSSTAGGSWGRSSVSGVLSGFQGGSLGVDRASLAHGSRLPTHIEADSPIKSAHSTPTHAQSGAGGAAAAARHAPTFRSASPDTHSNASSREDVTSPPLDVVGGIPLEGGPGGSRGGGGVRVTDGGKRMVNHGLPGNGARTSMHAAPAQSFGSSMQAANTNNPALVSDFVNSKVRRESLDPASAEKALRQVENALKGLGVTGSALED